MMGSQGVPASAVDELKGLLGLVSDPARLKEALSGLQAQQKALAEMVKANEAIASDVAKKQLQLDIDKKFIEKEKVDMSRREDAVRRLEENIEARALAIVAAEAKIQDDRVKLDMDIAVSMKKINDNKIESDRTLIAARESEEKAIVLKSDLESKITKLQKSLEGL